MNTSNNFPFSNENRPTFDDIQRRARIERAYATRSFIDALVARFHH